MCTNSDLWGSGEIEEVRNLEVGEPQDESARMASLLTAPLTD